MTSKTISHRVLLLIPAYYAISSFHNAIRIYLDDQIQNEASIKAAPFVGALIMTAIAYKWTKKIWKSPYKWGFWSGFSQALVVLIQFVLWKAAVDDPRKSHMIDANILHVIPSWIPHIAFIVSAVVLKRHWLEQKRIQRASAQNG